jgi:hypothetical protein
VEQNVAAGAWKLTGEEMGEVGKITRPSLDAGAVVLGVRATR